MCTPRAEFFKSDQSKARKFENSKKQNKNKQALLQILKFPRFNLAKKSNKNYNHWIKSLLDPVSTKQKSTAVSTDTDETENFKMELSEERNPRGGKSRGRGSWRGHGGRGGGNFLFKKPQGPSSFVPSKGPAVPVGQAHDTRWRPYLTFEDMSDASVQLKIQAAKNYLSRNEEIREQAGTINPESFSLDYNRLLEDTILNQEWPSLEENFVSETKKVIGIFGYAYLDFYKQDFDNEESTSSYVFPRIFGFKNFVSINKLKGTDIGKLTSVCGTCIRVENITQFSSWLTFLVSHMREIKVNYMKNISIVNSVSVW